MQENLFTHVDFVSYDEMFSILHKKYKATHDELRFWIKRTVPIWQKMHIIDNPIFYDDDDRLCYDGPHYLMPFESDLPFGSDVYQAAIEGYQDHRYCFYRASDVHDFIPPPHLRLVYLRELSAKRNWSDYKKEDLDEKRFTILELANKAGLLRVYDKEIDEFTYHRTFCLGDRHAKKLWADTIEGSSILSDPETFFLLEDILKIERSFFNKPREVCLKELEIKTETPDLKVIDFMAQKKSSKKSDKRPSKFIVIKDIPDFKLGKLHRILSSSVYTQESKDKGEETLTTIRVQYYELNGEQIIEMMNNYNCSIED